jgi:SRSO17 transposase
VGLLAAEGRKSVEPLAAVTAPAGLSVQHQKLLHFVANAPWPDERVLAKVREMVVPAIERHGPIEAWIIDDTAFPSRAPTRSACIISTAGSSASRPIVRWW